MLVLASLGETGLTQFSLGPFKVVQVWWLSVLNLRLWRQILEIVPDSLAPNLKKVRVDLCGTTYKSMVKYEK